MALYARVCVQSVFSGVIFFLLFSFMNDFGVALCVHSDTRVLFGYYCLPTTINNAARE